MKVVSSHQMSDIESLAYRDGASEFDFMEEAGSGIALIVQDYAERNEIDRIAILLCGKGNNGGDAYVAGIHLLHLDYDVIALSAKPIEGSSSLCRQNYERFVNEGGRIARSVRDLPKTGIIIDGIFGTGFQGKAEEPYASLISYANHSGLPIIAVDIPSGLNGETGAVEGEAIIAQETGFLGLPKTGFFLREGWNHAGKLRYVDFGLPKEYIDRFESDLIMLSEEIVKPLLPPIIRNRHKYQKGFVVGLAGSPGMPGAAQLSSTAALRGGAGIVRLLHPDGMQAELAASLYEIIRVPFHYSDPQKAIEEMNRASAVYAGPGMGRTEEVRKFLRAVLPKLQKPCVLDADALYFLSQEEIDLPPHTILTPHLGEMTRLLKMEEHPELTLEFIQRCRDYAEEHGATLVLKGAPSFILHPGDPIYVNPTGDPAMATAGSGDVLTGLLAALLAAGLAPRDAANLGVYLHGLAGEHAADDVTSYGVIASDIIYRFPEAFRFLPL